MPSPKKNSGIFPGPSEVTSQPSMKRMYVIWGSPQALHLMIYAKKVTQYKNRPIRKGTGATGHTESVLLLKKKVLEIDFDLMTTEAINMDK